MKLSGKNHDKNGNLTDAPNKEVEEFHEFLKEANYYQILGVYPDATRKEIRTKYFTLSKKFHPDSGVRAVSNDIKRKKTVIFDKVTRAYDVLTTPKLHNEYDIKTADQLELMLIEKKLSDAVKKPKPNQPAPKVTTPTPVKPSSATTGTTTTRESTPAMEAKRARWKKERMSKALGSFIPPKKRPSIPKISQDALNGLLEHSQIALSRGEIEKAKIALNKVLKIDPSNKQTLSLLNQVKAAEKVDSTKNFLRVGRMHRKNLNYPAAIAALENAIQIAPDNLDARHELAITLLKSRKDLAKAVKLSKEIVSIGGQKAQYFATLGELLVLTKDTSQARAAFEHALSLDPQNRDYKKRLKDCKG